MLQVSYTYMTEGTVAATQIDLDEEALAAAMRATGVRTKKGVVNLALRELADRRRRAETRLAHFTTAQKWDDASFWGRHDADKSGSLESSPELSESGVGDSTAE